MNKNLKTSLSVEQFAAYLDGNLMPDEMQKISSLVSKETDLRMLLETNVSIERTLAEYSDNDVALPEELRTLDFSVPEFDGGTLGAVNFSPELSENNSLTGEYLEDESNAFLSHDGSEELTDTLNHSDDNLADNLNLNNSDQDADNDHFTFDNNDF